jgi:hypothetical protein
VATCHILNVQKVVPCSRIILQYRLRLHLIDRDDDVLPDIDQERILQDGSLDHGAQDALCHVDAAATDAPIQAVEPAIVRSDDRAGTNDHSELLLALHVRAAPVPHDHARAQPLLERRVARVLRRRAAADLRIPRPAGGAGGVDVHAPELAVDHGRDVLGHVGRLEAAIDELALVHEDELGARVVGRDEGGVDAHGAELGGS